MGHWTRNLAVWLLALAGAALLAGCSRSGTGASTTSATPALWEVTAPNGDVGWLFGTIHALPDGTKWRTPTFDKAFAQSGLLVVEVANLADTKASFQQFEKRAYSPGLPALAMRVTPAERPELAALMKKAHADASDFNNMESWAAALVLASGVQTGDPDNGVDRQLLATGKPTLGLESFAIQFGMFDNLSPQDQHDLLMSTVNEARDNDSKKLLHAWLSGNTSELASLANAGLLQYPHLRQVLVTDRNNRWVGRIAQLVRQGRKPFVAVGAGHMVGKDALPGLLQAHGFKVTRIQ